MLRDLRTELHLLDVDGVVLFPALLLLLQGLELEAPVVHETADRWLGQRGDFDQVQLTLGGELPRPLDGDDPQLFTCGVVEETDGGNSDLVVDPQLSECDRRGLLMDKKTGQRFRYPGIGCWTFKAHPEGEAVVDGPALRRLFSASGAEYSTRARALNLEKARRASSHSGSSSRHPRVEQRLHRAAAAEHRRRHRRRPPATRPPRSPPPPARVATSTVAGSVGAVARRSSNIGFTSPTRSASRRDDAIELRRRRPRAQGTRRRW